MIKEGCISTTIFGPPEKEVLLLEDVIPLISESGFSFIEISRKHLFSPVPLKKIEKYGLKVWAVHGSLGFNSTSNNEEIRKKEIEKEIEIMKKFECFSPCIYVVHYLNRFLEPSFGIAFRKSIEELLSFAEKTGFNLAIETVPNKLSNERYPDSKEIVEFVRSFKSNSISICMDVNHSNLAENIEKAIDNCSGLISNVHISDNLEVEELHLVPGEGIIDFKKVVKTLKISGYKGPLNLECHTPDYPDLKKLKQLKKWIDNILNN